MGTSFLGPGPQGGGLTVRLCGKDGSRPEVAQGTWARSPAGSLKLQEVRNGASITVLQKQVFCFSFMRGYARA